MYKIIGADGKEYGPITADQLRKWIAEGRANGQTRVLVDGTTEWKTLSEFPELFPEGVAPPTLQPIPMQVTGSGNAENVVAGPAIGLMVLAALNLVSGALGILSHLARSSMGVLHHGPQAAWATMYSGSLGLVSYSLGIMVSAVIFYGGLKMKRLENHGLAVAASILSIIPCTSPCCFVGIPIGIWALVVLTKPEVKSAFR
jgi:hypothetical protein